MAKTLKFAYFVTGIIWRKRPTCLFGEEDSWAMSETLDSIVLKFNLWYPSPYPSNSAPDLFVLCCKPNFMSMGD